jgi:hypothetical protein
VTRLRPIALCLDRDRGCVGLRIPGHECRGPLDGHEPLRRSQGSDPTNADEVVMVCRGLHEWIGQHPREARELGLSVSQGVRYRNGRLVRRCAECGPVLHQPIPDDSGHCHCTGRCDCECHQ